MRNVFVLKEKSNNILLLAITFSLGIYFIFECAFLGSDLYYCIIGEEGYSWNDELGYIIETAITVVLIAAALISTVIATTKNRKWILVAIFILAGLMAYHVSLGMLNCLIFAIVWYKNTGAELQLEDDKLLKTAMILAAISFASVLVLPLYGLILWLLSPNNVDSTWMMFVFGSQLISFVMKPELVVMVYLFRKSKGREEAVYRKIRKTTKLYFVLWILLVAVMLLADLMQNGMLSQWFGSGDAGVEAGDWSEWETEEEAVYYDDDGDGTTFEAFEFD